MTQYLLFALLLYGPYTDIQFVRVIDGDTFEARIGVWPQMSVAPSIRVRGINAPEMHAPTACERALAVKAKAELVRLLKPPIALSDIGTDKYGGRYDARVMAAGVDVGAALLAGQFARVYGVKGPWCKGES